MSPRIRVLVLVVVLAGAAAAVVVGGTLLQTDGDAAPPRDAATRPSGEPPLLLDLGVRTDPEARDLRRAEELVSAGRRDAAAAVFQRHDSLEARVGVALARWPDGSVAALRELAAANPRSALVRLNLGFALFWSGEREEAVRQWRQARRVEPDTLSAVRADDLLHPNAPRGIPVFVSSAPVPRAIAALAPDRQLSALERAARARDVEAKLHLGVALQRLGRRLSARRVFDEAAALAPDDPEPQVAAAVARFDKADPSAAFSRLGPLSRRFPDAPTVRFHLGLLLLWTGAVDEARTQLQRAAALDPSDPLAREANRFLARLGDLGTN
ncbi:MAG TPA: tetratricopeptide repeat protein [Gaiellaceae bacterium]|nr:tetratricopeptide repeat protein [Gaiellaceae bacterium]